MRNKDEWDIEDEMMSSSDFSFSSDGSEETFVDVGTAAASPFNIKLLKESIETGRKILKNIQGKNVVLVIGKTGTGKSTFIQGIAGKKLHSNLHITECDGKAVEKDVYDAQDALPEFMIGHAKASQTKAFCCFVPEHQEGNEEVVYVDTPGFEDTHHEEVDIATSVMLSHIAKMCKSIRFVVLINYTSLLEDRGGAARSILRFTRAFVKDFSKDKQGFMFLFTHINEIRGVSDHLPDSRDALLDEILRLRKDSASTEKELLGLLDFLKSSLRKGYPFADVLHPLESDFSAIKKSIESKLSPIKSLTMADSCGLTLASKHRLSGEVAKISLDSRKYLQSKPPNLIAVKENHELMEYLCIQMNFGEVQKARDESNVLIKSYIDTSTTFIEEGIEKGGANELMFSVDDAMDIRETLCYMNVFDAHNVKEHFDVKINDLLSTIEDALRLSGGEMTHTHTRIFDKLKSWSTAFPEHEDRYSAVVHRLNNSIKSTIESVSEFEISTDLQTETLSAFCKNISFLNSIHQKVEVLLNHELAINAIDTALSSVEKRISEFLNPSNTHASVDPPDGLLEEEAVRKIAAQLRVLEGLHLGLNAQRGFEDTVRDVGEYSMQLEETVSNHFEVMCQDTKERKIDEMRERLHRIQVFLDLCSSIGGFASGGMRQNLKSLIDVIKEKVKSMSMSLLQIALPPTFPERIPDGGETGHALNSFAAHAWFDDFLPKDSTIVSSVCEQVQQRYERASTTIQEMMLNHLDFKNVKLPDGHVKQNGTRQKAIFGLKQVTVLYSKFIEIERFAETTKNTMMLANSLAVRKEISSRAAKAVMAINDSSKSSEFDFVNPAKTEKYIVKCSAHLEEISLLQSITKDTSCLESLESTRCKVMTKADAFAEDIQKVFESGIDFESMARLLCLLSKFECDENISTFMGLPSAASLKEKARVAVSRQFEKVQSLITETSDWATIEEERSLLEKCHSLDNILKGEVTKQLKTLGNLVKDKEMKVDSRISEMIASEDYVGIGEFLAPLAKSKDQLQRKKFQSYLQEIQKSLKTRFGKTSDFLLGGLPPTHVTADIVQNLDKLKEVHDELSKNLRYGMSQVSGIHKLKEILSKETRALKSKLNQKLIQSLKQMEMDAKALKITRLTSERKASVEFVDISRKHIDGKNLVRLQRVQENYDGILNSVPRLVNQFFDADFMVDKELVTILRALKRASLPGSTETSDHSQLYQSTRNDVNDRLRDRIEYFKTMANEKHCFADCIFVLRSLQRHLDSGLKDHVDDDIVLKAGSLLNLWDAAQNESHAIFNQIAGHSEDAHLQIAKKLDKLDPSTSFISRLRRSWYGGSEYKSLQIQTQDFCFKAYEEGRTALQNGDYAILDERLKLLMKWDRAVNKHVKSISPKIDALHNGMNNKFLDICAQLNEAVRGGSTVHYKSIFDDFRSIILSVSTILETIDCQRAFSLTNQLFFEKLEREIEKVKDTLSLNSLVNFLEIKLIVEDVRSFGDFMADHYAVFFEEVKNVKSARDDPWIKSIAESCHEQFDAGRDFRNIRHYIVLGVAPSASYADIKQSYHLLAKKLHPDKVPEKDEKTTERFRKIKEAWEALNDKERLDSRPKGRAFDRLVYGFRECLLKTVGQNLKTQRYDVVAQFLGRLYSLRELNDLVIPPLDSKHTEESVNKLVCGHVEQVRISVNTHWSERNFKGLQEDIEDLRNMEKHFKSYSTVFRESWNDGIIKTIENEVLALAKEARLCLASGQIAKDRKGDFRRLFLEMGHVLVELPLFKDFTKSSISSVLESCLDEGWGYSYLFDLGLSLQKGDDGNADESRIGQLLLSEFSHFKEVMTMVWNEETLQKPVEDTIKDINGYIQRHPQRGKRQELDIKRDQLLDHFLRFDSKYKTLLGEFLDADADLNALVRTTTKLADQMKPLSCDKGWSTKIKGVIPDLFAGVFALFTVLKSGDAYNRLQSSPESSDLGEKLLMKPHNIQVSTLLCMFGCGRPSNDSLESQLMQIRTGEGKSMILGAAATVLGLLGFRVRCVCYSEYLSCRDYGLFEDVFKRFKIDEDIVYSKITALSEDTTAAKGDIRYLTESLVLGNLPQGAKKVPKPSILSEVNVNVESMAARERKLAARTPCSLPASLNKKESDSLYNGGLSKSTRQGSIDDRSAFHDELHLKQSECRIEETNISAEIASDLAPKSFTKEKEEILLVDEVDVFFGSEFYGQTYNQVAQLREPEIADILKSIWREHNNKAQGPRLSYLKESDSYKSLLQKMKGYEFLLDNEIFLMLKHAKRADEEPYFLDEIEQRIGYKVMDSVSYNVTYGYRTAFAYLKEYEKGTIKDSTLQRVLTMPVSCGQFSYADIKPTRILGVSGTLDVMTSYEKEVLSRYGVDTYLNVPSVYGKSNFSFDEAGDGLSIECSKSDFYHKICEDIKRITGENRAVIVFFKDMASVKDFTSSPFYQKLGKQKKVLSEEMGANDKDFVINKAATAKQITICPAVFGRGTDFFCKDTKVEKNGGVHVIQTFLSEQRSEEVQIQGRTARQGKQGSYKLILLEDDVVQTFLVKKGEKNRFPKADWYRWLCDAREKQHKEHAKKIEGNLAEATKKNKNTHDYFDALLTSNPSSAKSLFKGIYLAMKRPIPSTVLLNLAFAIDVTGSMHPFSRDLPSILNTLLQGQDSITTKLKVQFPELTFKLCAGLMGFRDIDDKPNQFEESVWSNGTHFTSNMNNVIHQVQKMVSGSSGGHDLAEDSLGAIHRGANWKENDDWSGTVNCLLVLTDAPAHGFAPPEYAKIQNGDSYGVRHPAGLTVESVVGGLLERDIDLFFCSFNPTATSKTEQGLMNAYLKHAANTDEKEVSCIPMVQAKKQSVGSFPASTATKHIVFVLDESGSMNHEWSGVVKAYQKYVARRLQSQSTLDLVSVVQFDSNARLTVDCEPITSVPNDLGYCGGGTCFSPAAALGSQVAQKSPASHVPVVVFMSDGGTGGDDSAQAAQILSQLNSIVLQRYNSDLELHVIAFGGGADTRQLSDISRASGIGRLHASADANALTQVFESIASGQDVTTMVESQIGKRISDAVANKLSLEYMG